MDNPALAEELISDPVLRHLKMIAWPGNEALLPRGGERGFPHWGLWLERNTRFTTDMLAAIACGEPGLASRLATRCGLALILSWHYGACHSHAYVGLLPWSYALPCCVATLGGEVFAPPILHVLA